MIELTIFRSRYIFWESKSIKKKPAGHHCLGYDRAYLVFFFFFGPAGNYTRPFNFGEQLFLQQHLICHELLHVSRRYPYRLLVFIIFVPHHSFSASSHHHHVFIFMYWKTLSISRACVIAPVKHIKAARSSVYSLPVEIPFPHLKCMDDVLISHPKRLEWPSKRVRLSTHNTHCLRYVCGLAAAAAGWNVIWRREGINENVVSVYGAYSRRDPPLINHSGWCF